ncbi:tRNA (adenosine(37)-N6)-threonylcarbamoyltransferase complex transferase subunit TsaD [Patescibacteria group bacterium]|nr:tRNA (adenosine(37)-N6)-threonylcarbamoyltransferase complex transferase subunit TsaD [Patescibacteria group bacterium]MBU1931261.1 tRNA (adenosine(37)-N6)-threonylcarbamoyltransferase complex transferase subunit TsaD [Patescibacteria group bacterium]
MIIKKNYTILAIDTSCDETSVAITRDDRVLANIVASQVVWHQEYGGVVPNIAKRMHQQLIEPAIKQALQQARIKNRKTIDAFAVTVGPGLAPALEVGITKAKKLALKLKKPLIAVNHMEGHLLASLAKNSRGNGGFKPRFPILGLLVSGGHTQLVLMKDFGDYRLLGETLDDAAGEAFDKVAKMLDLGYPGGPIISELAKKGQPKYDLPIPMMRSPGLDFSFSGLKTACLYKINPPAGGLKNKIKKNPQFYCDFAASFEAAASLALTVKLKRAIKQVQPKQIVLGGGVINNLCIRRETRRVARQFGLKVFLPYSNKFLTDNAGMIGVCAWHQAKRGDFVKDIVNLDRLPGLNFTAA